MTDPEAGLYGATPCGNEYAWKPDAFPRALDDALSQGLACLGGQFQFQLPDGTCEIYWFNADSAPRATGEPWSVYAARSVAEVRRGFERLMRDTDFLAPTEHIPFLRQKRTEGLNLLEFLWFVAYFSRENERYELLDG